MEYFISTIGPARILKVTNFLLILPTFFFFNHCQKYLGCYPDWLVFRELNWKIFIILMGKERGWDS